VDQRSFLSIGEVLDLLKAEFPDVTISKIRFLESQGLLDPERTPSGYRKFYEADIERLRWILQQQREHFLPLKVIKGRLVSEAAPAPPPPRVPTVTAPPRPRPLPVAVPADADGDDRPFLSAGESGATLTREELASASGLSADSLAQLERFGLLVGRSMAGGVYYDEEALLIANLAAGFMHFGVEARHLRMYRNTVEREAGLLEQLVLPLLKQRNPQSRRKAVEMLTELAQLGGGLRQALLRQELRAYLDGA
jgi:DNA-binding transcriptional MerR regulator